MLFRSVISHLGARDLVSVGVLLVGSEWDDYGRRTTFRAYWCALDAPPSLLGTVKILDSSAPVTKLPDEFHELAPSQCSLGQEQVYYDRLRELGNQGEEILRALRDVALGTKSYVELEKLEGMESSLFRATAARAAFDHARRIWGATPTTDLTGVARTIKFSFQHQLKGFRAAHRVEFSFSGQRPLGRVAAIVGRNGAGKSQLLGALAHTLTGLAKPSSILMPEVRWGCVITMSYSAFDHFNIPQGELPLPYFYCGLRRFSEGGTIVDVGAARNRWAGQLRTLSTEHPEQLFESLANLQLPIGDPELAQQWTSDGAIGSWLQRLSAGQLLATGVIVDLLTFLQRRSILLFDEPENHMHPALLAALLRELHRLLDVNDSYAIIATHSPLPLQELAGKRVQLLEVEAGYPATSQYPGESFGENLGELTKQAFALGRGDRNYMTELQRAADAAELDILQGEFTQPMSTSLRLLLDAFRASS